MKIADSHLFSRDDGSTQILNIYILVVERITVGFSEIHHPKRSFALMLFKYWYIFLSIFTFVQQKLNRYKVSSGKACLRRI